jgi:DNA-binding transcriptional ArsR family regulator
MVVDGSRSAGLRAASELLAALAHPHRLAIILQLGEGSKCVHVLVSALGVTQPLVSQHLRVLRGARLVAAERRGKEVIYALEDAHVAHIVDDAVRHARERGSDP